MKYNRILVIVLTLLLYNCTESKQENKVDSEKIEDKMELDTLEIENKINNLYHWIFVSNVELNVFPLSMNDTIFTGVDFDLLDKNQSFIKGSNLFSENFINNYRLLYQKMDTIIRDSINPYYVNDILPFFNDANPWCDCQDFPDFEGDFINVIDYRVNLTNDQIFFYWNWKNESNNEYLVILLNNYKVEYLQGFDISKFEG